MENNKTEFKLVANAPNIDVQKPAVNPTNYNYTHRSAEYEMNIHTKNTNSSTIIINRDPHHLMTVETMRRQIIRNKNIAAADKSSQ